MRVAAVGDVHGQEHLDALRTRLEEPLEADLLLLAGDLTHRNDLSVFGEVLDILREAVDAPPVAVFGNHEWADSWDDYRDAFDIPFLQDEAKTFAVAGQRVRVVGSRGVLDRPTWWQRRNVEGIRDTYTRRVETLDELLDAPGVRVLLTHYAPTFRTLVGEGEDYWDQLGSRRMERVLLRRRPMLAVHGHAHRGSAYAELRTNQATLDDFGGGRTIPIHNVAFPVREGVSVLDLETG